MQAIIFMAIIRLMDAYEREPLWIVGLLAIWGGTFAVGFSILGNGAVSNMLSEDMDTVFGAAISAPLVEELAKGVAIVLAFLGSRWFFKKTGRLEFEGVTDGDVTTRGRLQDIRHSVNEHETILVDGDSRRPSCHRRPCCGDCRLAPPGPPLRAESTSAR